MEVEIWNRSLLVNILTQSSSLNSLSSLDRQLIARIRSVLERSQANARLSLAVESFSESLRRTIACGGNVRPVFFIRSEDIRECWLHIWAIISDQFDDLAYRGIDTLGDYLLLIILRHSSVNLLIDTYRSPSSSEELSVSSTHPIREDIDRRSIMRWKTEISSGDYGVYGSIDEPPSATPNQVIGNDGDTVFDAASIPTIPAALIDRYRDQASFFIIRAIEASRSGQLTSCSASRATTILDMLEKLSSVELDHQRQEIIVPSPELMQLLLLIDHCAVEFASEPGLASFEQLLSHLTLDRSLITGAKHLLEQYGYVENDIVVLIGVIVDLTGKSIWKSVGQSRQINERNATSVSFRTDVQMGSNRKRKNL